MANRKDFYFRHNVTESELDAAFNDLEVADFNLSVDHALVGIVEGMGVSEKSGTPDLTVDVAGPGAAYSKQGERIAFNSLQNVDLSVDDGAVSTVVGTPGNSRVISLFVTFDRLLSDPRIDGNSNTVFHVRDESFAFSVVAGAEAVTGLEVPPALDPNKILLADITRDFGQTQLLNADVAVTRREDAYRLTGTVPVVAGTALAALTLLLTALNQHIDGGAFNHPAADSNYAGGSDWIDATANPAATVEAQLDKIITDLGTGTGGAAKLTAADSVATWHDATAVVPTVKSIQQFLERVVTQIADAGIIGNGGADRVGAAAQTVVAEILTSGSIFDQLNEVLTLLNAKGKLAAANSWTAANDFDQDIVANSPAEFVYDAVRSTPKHIPMSSGVSDGGWAFSDTSNEWSSAGGVGSVVFPIVNVPNGAVITGIEATVDPSNTSDTLAINLLKRNTSDWSNPPTQAVANNIGGAQASGGAFQRMGTGILSETVDNSANEYWIRINASSAVGTEILSAIRFTFDDPGPRNG